MTNFVLDSSVTLAWAFGDQGDHYTDGVLSALLEGEALVPTLWVLEVANGLFVAERRQRLTPAEADGFARNLAALPIRLDESDTPQGVGHILTLGRSPWPHGLRRRLCRPGAAPRPAFGDQGRDPAHRRTQGRARGSIPGRRRGRDTTREPSSRKGTLVLFTRLHLRRPNRNNRSFISDQRGEIR